MPKVEGELQGVKDQIKEKERKERRRREEGGGGDDMEDDAFLEEAGSCEVVGVRVQVGKRRKVARQERFTGGRVALGRGEVDVEEIIRQLRGLSEEHWVRCMRTFAEPSDGEVSSLSDENSG